MKMKKLLLVIAVICTAVFFSACNEPSNPSPTRVAVTLDLNGGEIEGSVSHTVSIGENLILNTPSKYGFDFVGWSHDGEIVCLSPFTIEKYAVTLKAKWSVKPCTVTLDLCGGTLPSGVSQTYVVEVGETVQIPTPQKEGYDFSGWLYNSGDISFSPFTVEQVYDMTVKAKWSAKTYNVTLNFNGGVAKINGEDKTSISIKQTYGEVIDFPRPEKVGYEFGGYKINGKHISESTWSVSVDNVVVVAVWLPVKVNYKLVADGATLALEGGTINYGASTQGIKAVVPVKKGYDFLGWKVNGEFIGDWFEYLPTSTTKVNVVAEFSPKTYTITLNAGEGILQGDTQIEMSYGVGHTLPKPEAPFGKEFLGWKINGGDFISTPSSYCVYTCDCDNELVAEYTDKQFLVFVHIDGSIEHVQILGELTSESIPIPKSKVGCTIAWELSNEDILEITETTEIFAVIESVRTYVANFKYGGRQLFQKEYKYNQVITLPSVEHESVARTGYTFLGWAFSQSDKENYIYGEYTWKFTSMVNLYAVYEATEYTITYDYSNIKVDSILYNGDEPTANRQTVTYNSSYRLYTLKVADDLVSVTWTYNGEELTTSTWKIASDVTLVAKPVSYKNVSFSVNVDLNGGTGKPYGTVILGKPLSKLTEAPTPPTDYKLSGYKYRDKVYALTDIWDVLDYGGEPLIAQYEVVEPTITVNIDLNGGTGTVRAKIQVGKKLTTISPKPTAENGYKLTGFIYNGKFYAMNDVWDVYDYDGSYLIAQYEDDSGDWGPLV